MSQHNHEQAKEYFFKSLELRKKILGEEHADIAACYKEIGYMLEEMGRFQ
jgi:hypothetical protein